MAVGPIRSAGWVRVQVHPRVNATPNGWTYTDRPARVRPERGGEDPRAVSLRPYCPFTGPGLRPARSRLPPHCDAFAGPRWGSRCYSERPASERRASRRGSGERSGTSGHVEARELVDLVPPLPSLKYSRRRWLRGDRGDVVDHVRGCRPEQLPSPGAGVLGKPLSPVTKPLESSAVGCSDGRPRGGALLQRPHVLSARRALRTSNVTAETQGVRARNDPTTTRASTLPVSTPVQLRKRHEVPGFQMDRARLTSTLSRTGDGARARA